jgi:hypothetical protein
VAKLRGYMHRHQQPDRRIFPLATLLSTGSRTVAEGYRAGSHSGVTCLPSTPCAARLKTFNPSTTLREGDNLPLTAPESPHCRARNRRIGGRIGIAKRG